MFRVCVHGSCSGCAEVQGLCLDSAKAAEILLQRPLPRLLITQFIKEDSPFCLTTQRATKGFSVAKPPKVGYVILRNPPLSLPYYLP